MKLENVVDLVAATAAVVVLVFDSNADNFGYGGDSF